VRHAQRAPRSAQTGRRSTRAPTSTQIESTLAKDKIPPSDTKAIAMLPFVAVCLNSTEATITVGVTITEKASAPRRRFCDGVVR
jgi:hypothetical protein